MDFADILKRWEKRQKAENIQAYLEAYPPDSRAEHSDDSRHSRRALLRLKPERQLDLHGMRQDEARQALESFIRDCKTAGIRKTLIIHGKGNHSQAEAVLGKTVRSFLERSSLTGEFGYAAQKEGGRGASWVILR